MRFSVIEIGTTLYMLSSNHYSASHYSVNTGKVKKLTQSGFYTQTATCSTFPVHEPQLTLTVLVATIDAQWEGMGDVGSERYEPALLPPCATIKVLSYSN